MAGVGGASVTGQDFLALTPRQQQRLVRASFAMHKLNGTKPSHWTVRKTLNHWRRRAGENPHLHVVEPVVVACWHALKLPTATVPPPPAREPAPPEGHS